MVRAKTESIKTFKRHYALIISERQAELISHATELYARFGTGHFFVLEKFFWTDLKRARPHFEKLQLIKNGSLDVLPGIYAAEDNYRALYDLHQVIRHRLIHVQDPKAKSWTVNHNTPLRASIRESLARFEKIVVKGDLKNAATYATKKKPSDCRYVLEISERQAQLISDAVELNARLGMGQFEELTCFFWSKGGSLEKARPHIDSLRLIKNGSLNSSPGICSKSVDDDYRVLYDLHQVIRHRLAWDRDPKATVCKDVRYDTPRQLSKDEHLAIISAVAVKPTRAKSNA
mgnify:CR=1 FL=1